MTISDQVSPALEGMVQAWCERRALRPLRYILGVYPLPQGIWETAVCQSLLEALKDVRGLCHDDLLPSEHKEIGRLIVLLQNDLVIR